MSIFDLLIIAVGLSMDAFAVALCSGTALGSVKLKNNFKVAFSFGIFQGVMPLIGYTIARTFADKIRAIDHWIAFALLAFIGGKMLYEAIKKGDSCEIPRGNPTSFINLFVMGVATSIDALAVGVYIAVMDKTGVLSHPYGSFFSFLIIGIITFLISFFGVHFGSTAGEKFGKRAEIVGGVVLVGMGIKILIEHIVKKI